jgi:hypothetical protein
MMKGRKNRSRTAGLLLHILIGGLMILTGSEKVLGLVPREALARYGLGEQVRLIGAGAILAALLVLMPRTSSLGILLTSAFWGGAICIHMAHGEPYLFPVVMLVLLWVGAYLRKPALLSSFSELPERARAMVANPELAVPRPVSGLPLASVVGLSRSEVPEDATAPMWVI